MPDLIFVWIVLEWARRTSTFLFLELCINPIKDPSLTEGALQPPYKAQIEVLCYFWSTRDGKPANIDHVTKDKVFTEGKKTKINAGTKDKVSEKSNKLANSLPGEFRELTVSNEREKLDEIDRWDGGHARRGSSQAQ